MIETMIHKTREARNFNNKMRRTINGDFGKARTLTLHDIIIMASTLVYPGSLFLNSAEIILTVQYMHMR